MKIGTKSILFGVHQFLWHPITVLLAWRKLYKEWPSWPELLAIIFHDIGYWRMPNMDGEEGKYHPYAGAFLTTRLYLLLSKGYWVKEVPPEGCYGNNLFWFTALHSRDTAKLVGGEPSKLYVDSSGRGRGGWVNHFSNGGVRVNVSGDLHAENVGVVHCFDKVVKCGGLRRDSRCRCFWCAHFFFEFDFLDLVETLQRAPGPSFFKLGFRSHRLT